MIQLKYSLILIFYVLIVPLRSQNLLVDSTQISKDLELTIYNGKAMTSSPTFFNQTIDKEDVGKFRAIGAKYVFRTHGKHKWEELYGYPTYGFGAILFDFFTPKTTGYPIALYGFFNPRLFHKNNFSINSDIALGMGFNWNHYGYFNSDNSAISLPRTVYIELGTTLDYQVSNKINLLIGGLVGHFSNGGTRRPNQGLNTLGLKYSLRYNLNNSPIKFKHYNAESYASQSEFLLSIHGGTQNFQVDSLSNLVADKFKGVNFVAWGFSGEYQRQINHFVKFGCGINILDDGSVGASYLVKDHEIEEAKILPINQRLKISAFPSLSIVLHKIDIVLQPGIYIYRNAIAKDVPLTYQRIGVRYHINEKIFSGINLRAYNFKSANFIEYNFGYKF